MRNAMVYLGLLLMYNTGMGCSCLEGRLSIAPNPLLVLHIEALVHCSKGSHRNVPPRPSL